MATTSRISFFEKLQEYKNLKLKRLVKFGGCGINLLADNTIKMPKAIFR